MSMTQANKIVNLNKAVLNKVGQENKAIFLLKDDCYNKR